MAKRGRPVLEINWVDFEKLCALHCTLEEIASFFDCSSDTIERRVKSHYHANFAEVFRQKSAKGKISLRRKMYETAVNGGNVTMMIWLSKQMLGYTDKQTQEITGKDGSDLFKSFGELAERVLTSGTKEDHQGVHPSSSEES